ncbi:MAG: HEPN domain-containing protein [Candidatus Omnitrophica bacterium]|nr:HEPN domain-containing protein [Candidatus Omnitrophota bacterium]
MKKITKKWLPYIEADLNLAEAGLKGKRANKWTCLLIIWHCQQAVEKSLKMYSIENGKELLLTHDLPRLLRYSDLKDEKNYSKFIIELNKYYAKPR